MIHRSLQVRVLLNGGDVSESIHSMTQSASTSHVTAAATVVEYGCWKHYVQELANETQMEIHVSHFPTGTSKWNKVEHRLFCYISKNWQGQPLIDVETVVNLIGSTTTEKGLSVICRVDENHYEPGKKITEEQKENLNIEFLGPNKKWNYIILPNV